MNNELVIWERINACKKVSELKDAIIEIWGKDGIIQGRTEPFSVQEMLVYIDQFEEDFKSKLPQFRSLPTRKFGIRQQLLFILVKPTR